MRLASDIIAIAHGRVTVPLRPSLRAAYRLNRRFGAGRLAQGVEEGRLEIIYAIIEEGGGQAATSLVERTLQVDGFRGVERFTPAIASFLRACFGVDEYPAVEHPAETRAKSGKPFDLDLALTEFFDIGTGWLGWTPEATWISTPAEIAAAQRGLFAKLKAIHGSADDRPDAYDPADLPTPEQVREGIETLRGLSGKVYR